MTSKSVEETAQIAQDFAAKMRPHPDKNQMGAAVIALSGDLGSGKTTFTKAFAAALGIPSEEITSPTFVIMKSYDISTNGFKKFIHIDAYRLEKAEEIEKLGWQKLISHPSNLILIEWPENIGKALPKDAQKASFKFMDDNTREIVFN
jgi:tRNA threonylcarbamoyladenosine biosynthesis protein TsaE